jgi:hypothetical protein
MEKKKINFIKSLHRPYNSRFKTTKWVCEFCSKPNKKFKQLKCSFTIKFYLFMIQKLFRLYKDNDDFDNYGLPSRNVIFNVHNELFNLSLNLRIHLIEQCMNPKHNQDKKIYKQIYSSYKSASYFITFTKNVLNLIDKRNNLTDTGYELIKIRNIKLLKLSTKEQNFFIKEIAKKDLFMIVSLVYFNKFEKKYELSKQEKIDLFLSFLNSFLDNKEFNYTKRSLSNYMIVRNKWIEELDLAGKSGTIKPSKLVILKNIDKYNLLEDYILSLKKIEMEKLKKILVYKKRRTQFIKAYKKLLTLKTIKKYKYVNLYDIKLIMNLSYNKIQYFLERFVKDENYKYKIHFNNIVYSIDSRKRFIIRNSPVINIKISED